MYFNQFFHWSIWYKFLSDIDIHVETNLSFWNQKSIVMVLWYMMNKICCWQQPTLNIVTSQTHVSQHYILIKTFSLVPTKYFRWCRVLNKPGRQGYSPVPHQPDISSGLQVDVMDSALVISAYQSWQWKQRRTWTREPVLRFGINIIHNRERNFSKPSFKLDSSNIFEKAITEFVLRKKTKMLWIDSALMNFCNILDAFSKLLNH